MNPDGISYLDSADQVSKGNFSALLNLTWTPLYPCLLAVALKLFSPTPSGESVVVHFVNFVIGLGALSSFTFFVSQWGRQRGHALDGGNSMNAFRLQTGFAYVLFLWNTTQAIGLATVTPDLCVAAMAYLIAGLCCRLARSSGGQGTAVSLGIALGIGYLAKAPMLPLGVALLIILAIPQLFTLPRRSSLAVAGLFFLIVAAPRIFLMSRKEHRLTFSDAGTVNYVWFVLGKTPRSAGWVGPTPGAGAPLHPPRVLGVGPTILEFKDMAPGTYPLWYDPAYFYQGLQVHFDARKQIVEVIRSFRQLLLAHGANLSPLLGGIVVLGILAFRRRGRVDLSGSWLTLWALAEFSMYALIQIQPRLVGPFMVLFWIAIYDTVSLNIRVTSRPVQRGVLGAITLCMFASQLLYLGSAVIHSIGEPQTPTQALVARELTRLGLRPGEDIATVGYPFLPYYARLAHLRVIVNIGFRGGYEGVGYLDEAYVNLDAGQFWGLSDSEFDALKEKIRQVGVRAIVSPDGCSATTRKGWHAIPDTGYCVQLLDSPG